LTEGAGYIELPLPGLKYTVSPQTFYQAHWSLNIEVAECIMREAVPLAGKSVLDLYAGAGNFSLPLAGQAGDVVLVEENPHAIEDGTRNVKLNRLRNCRFVKSTAEKYRMQKKVDLLILDPPRPGLTTEVVKKILEHAPEKIIYISCNPATLSRDLKKLKGTYNITSVRLIDFFPNTYHIEALVFLRAR
jgi:23S rRNA (uracil1939-C5)-methyltransferase